MFLPFGTGIFRLSFAVESTLIANPYTFLVETAAVCTDPFYRTGRFYVPVLADIEMIPRSVESPSAMTDVQVIFCETLIFARSGAMDYYQIYSSHGWIK
jgi:hypothetical protein